MEFNIIAMEEIIKERLNYYQKEYLEEIERLIQQKNKNFYNAEDEELLIRYEIETNWLRRVRNSIRDIERFRFTDEDTLRSLIDGLGSDKKLVRLSLNDRRILKEVVWEEES
jgi:hypothetical protein